MPSRQLLVEQIPHLRRYARVLLGHGRHDEADDLVQDTLERACVKWHLWQPGRGLRPWLFAIMHNLSVDRRTAPSVAAERPLEDSPEPGIDADQEARVEALSLMRLVQALPLALREVLLLVCVEGLSYRETAQALDIPIGTVMSRLSRARSQLHHWMEKDLAGGRPPFQVITGNGP
jgi:RNA polymerase sigma-70 factor (ECF subfamily)